MEKTKIKYRMIKQQRALEYFLELINNDDDLVNANIIPKQTPKILIESSSLDRLIDIIKNKRGF